MSSPRPLVDRTLAVRVLTLQALAVLAVTLGLSLMQDLRSGLSAGAGGAIALVGDWYFARQAFRHAGAAAARAVVGGFYRGEAGKLLLTAALFAVVFTEFRSMVHAGWLFAGYIVALLTARLAPLVVASRLQK